MPVAGIRPTLAVLISAIGAAAAIDAVIIRYRRGAWEYPSGAVLTGMIIAMVLSPQEPWYVAAVASALGIVSKYEGGILFRGSVGVKALRRHIMAYG